MPRPLIFAAIVFVIGQFQLAKVLAQPIPGQQTFPARLQIIKLDQALAIKFLAHQLILDGCLGLTGAIEGKVDG